MPRRRRHHRDPGEHRRATATRVVVDDGAPAGKHVRRAGLDFSQGDVLLPRGRRLTGRDLALAAAMNHPTVPVHRRPQVAILATGDELVPPGATPGPGQIVSSNGFALMALARGEGADGRSTSASCPTASTTPSRPSAARATSAPTCWSRSAAPRSATTISCRRRWPPKGMDAVVLEVAMRPGKPLMFGRLGAMHVLGLPGNPVSAFVCAFLFLVPLIRAACRPRRRRRRDRAGRARLRPAGQRRARRLPARHACARAATARRSRRPFPIQDSSMMARSGGGRLPGRPRAVRAGGDGRRARARSLSLRVLAVLRLLHVKLNGCGTHMEQIVSVHDLFRRLSCGLGRSRGETRRC